MPVGNHPSFERPPVSTPLWRYTDVPKFIDMLTSSTLWLTNAEVLAQDDPFEGLPGPVQFPHRMWRTIEEVPEPLRSRILASRERGPEATDDQIFRGWFMGEEQRCIMTRSGRRDFYVSCWHAAPHESAAMWRIYGAPGAGVAIVTNGARIESALEASEQDAYLGAVKYRDPSYFQIGTPNAYDPMMIKSVSYAYEQEVRLVHWHTGEFHDALENFNWNDETMRFDDLIEDPRPLRPGLSLPCQIGVLVGCVIISPFAPPWYGPMIERLRDRLGFSFPVQTSRLLSEPPIIP